MPASARAAREQRAGERVGLDVHHHHVLAVPAAARARARCRRRDCRWRRSPPRSPGARWRAAASSVTQVVPSRAASSSDFAAIALRRPAHARERGARALGREVRHGEDVDARACAAPATRYIEPNLPAPTSTTRTGRFSARASLQEGGGGSCGRKLADGRPSSLPVLQAKMQRMVTVSETVSAPGRQALRNVRASSRASLRCSPGWTCSGCRRASSTASCATAT